MSKLNPAVVNGIAEALRSAGVDPTVPLASSAAAPVAADLVERLSEDPLVVNATNSEPWYQSKIALSAIATIIASATGLIALYQQGVHDATAYTIPVTTLVTASITLWSRLKKGTAPLGK